MKQTFVILLFCLFQMHLIAQSDLTVEITGLKVLKGELYVSLYNKESTYMKTEQAFGKVLVPANQELVRVKLKDVPKGDYALAVFQDMNANAMLDVNDMKIPKEPFGFSNNPQGLRGPATFQQARFHMDGELTLKIVLVNNMVTPNKDKSENPK